MISPIFDMDGVDERAMTVLIISPRLPSKSMTSTNVPSDNGPNNVTKTKRSSSMTLAAPIEGAFR